MSLRATQSKAIAHHAASPPDPALNNITRNADCYNMTHEAKRQPSTLVMVKGLKGTISRHLPIGADGVCSEPSQNPHFRKPADQFFHARQF